MQKNKSLSIFCIATILAYALLGCAAKQPQTPAQVLTTDAYVIATPPTTLYEALPAEERLYLSDADLISKNVPYTILPFAGEPISQKDMETLSAELEKSDWRTFKTALSNYDFEIDTQPILDEPVYGLIFDIMKNEMQEIANDGSKEEITNEVRQCMIETANPEYTVLQMKGIFGVRGYDDLNIDFYFSMSNDLYLPEYAAFRMGQDEWEKFITIGENTFLVSYIYGGTGTEYRVDYELWYNIKTQEIELNYIRRWLEGGLILPNTRCHCSYHIEDYSITAFADGGFAIEMPISIAATFDYYSAEETEEFLKGESMEFDEYSNPGAICFLLPSAKGMLASSRY